MKNMQLFLLSVSDQVLTTLHISTTQDDETVWRSALLRSLRMAQPDAVEDTLSHIQGRL